MKGKNSLLNKFKLLKYRKLLVLCTVVVFVKLCMTVTNWTVTDTYMHSRRDLPCHCAGFRDLAEGKTTGDHIQGTQSKDLGTGHTASLHRLNDSRINFHMKIVSEDPQTIHTWPWGGEDIIHRCQVKNWNALGSLPKISVIITFIDKENVATLLRTIHSVVQRTPAELLEEIILVEDNCTKEEFHQTLDIYLTAVFGHLVRVLRNHVTLGLIKARLTGIRAARGEVVVCMDSHVEVQHLWLEPLLYEIKTNRKTLATSYLDWIEQTDTGWSYRHGASSWKTYFDMGLVFGFQEISPKLLKSRENDPTAVVNCPVTVGTIWAMDRQFFTEIGEFDEGMQLWGGENLDLPLRTWLFGGRVVNVPCSHAAHLEVNGYRDYRTKWSSTINRNYRRFLQVWLGEYSPYFYPYFPGMEKLDTGDLSARLAIKQRAQYNITWYLDNIFPELGIPQIHGLSWGEVVNVGTKLCLKDTSYSAELATCGGSASNYYFYWSKANQELRFPMHVFNVKRSHDSPDVKYKLDKEEYTALFQMNASTVWLHWKNGPLMIEKKKLCLQGKAGSLKVELHNCDFNNPLQQWRFTHYTKDYTDLITGTASKYDGLSKSLQHYKKYFKHGAS